MFIFELPHVRGEFQVDGKPKDLPRAISQDFTLSLDKKSKLRPMLESWRGKEFTDEEANAFDCAKVAGAMAILSVIHKKSQDGTRTFANINAIMQPMKGTEKLTPENPIVVFDLPAHDSEAKEIVIPSTIPEWVVNKIKTSEEFLQFTNPQHSGSSSGPVSAEKHSENTQAFPTGGDAGDEDVPF
jgi:hypothetical protein